MISRFIECHRHRRFIDNTDVDTSIDGGDLNFLCVNTIDAHCVKDDIVTNLETGRLQRSLCGVCEAGDSLCYRTEAIRAVPTGVKSCDIGKEHLRRADIRCCLLSTNMLLASL